MKKKKSVSPLPLVLTLLVSACIAVGSLYLAEQAPAEAHEHPARREESTDISLWTEPESYRYEPCAEAAESDPLALSEESSFVVDEELAREEGVSISRIHGKDYRAVLAVVEDPTRLFVGTLDYYGNYGLTLEQLMEKHGAILGTNGGGFDDPNGEGNGGTPTGIVMVNGEYRWGGKYGEYDCLALTADGRLITGRRTGEYLESQNTLWAVCYGPALIVDGQVQELTSAQPEPRTAVGQRENGQMLLLIVEGRQVGALGVDLPRLASIMEELGAVNATNLDGGASSALNYRGTLMNRPNGLAGMRPMPTALLLAPSENGSEGGEP